MFKKLLLVAVLLISFTGSAVFSADLMQLIPQEADFVFQVNVAKFLSTPEIKKAFEENLAKNPDQKKAYEEFMGKTGFNPMEGLTQFVVFTSGKVDPTNAAQMAGAIIEGKFDPAKILEAIKGDKEAAKDVEISKIDGFDAIVPKNKKDGIGLFLDAGTAVVGAEPGVTAVKNIKLGKGKAVTERKDFFAILQKLDAQATISGAGLIPADLKEKVKQNPQAAPLAALNYFFFGFTHGENIVFNFNSEVDKKENVEGVMTALNGFLAMLKMFAAQAPEAAEVMNMIKLTANETTVQINLNVPKAKLEEIKAKMEQRVKEMKEKGGVDEAAPAAVEEPAASGTEEPAKDNAPEAEPERE
ncbi:MAG TPA: hypothetical protein PLM07_19180 [Candidatus Rifleibacterium sp.]|nr:hypothetical protein [Candidatus Rifleibacterium sp.]HPT48010.1 hypothetical protein [Candidatus Rifleibacterium sp.]